MSTATKDHGNWKKEHKQWLADHKKWLAGHKKVRSTMKNLDKALRLHTSEMTKLGKNFKKHDKMMGVKSAKHSNTMHKKFKKAHAMHGARHKSQSKIIQGILKINKALDKATKRFNGF